MKSSERRKLAEDIFDILKRRGPQCQSQLSAELLIGAKEIEIALNELKGKGAVEVRPEHLPWLREVEQPWGVRISPVVADPS